MGNGLRKSKGRRFYRADTAILVQSEVQSLPVHSTEHIALDLCTSYCSLHGLRPGTGGLYGRASLDSPSECCTSISSISTAAAAAQAHRSSSLCASNDPGSISAAPLDHKYRYHLFIAYHSADVEWIREFAARLEAEPYNYKCCYSERDFDSGVSDVQNMVCSIVLSQRIVVVLDRRFVEESWVDYEESIAHLSAFSAGGLCRGKQRVVPVMRGECTVPDTLKMLPAVDARQEDFWDDFIQTICLDGFPQSESLHTVKAATHPTPGFHNGQLLTRLTATIEGFCRSTLVFDHEEVPDSLACPSVSLSHKDYTDIVRTVGREDVGTHLSWLYSAWPTIILCVVFVFWCVAFVLVILLFPDNSSSTLPVRLSVFSLPGIFIVLSCVLRWRHLKHDKEQYSVCMFTRSVHVNKFLYCKSKPVIICTSRTQDTTFHIYFMYYRLSDCVERIKLFLLHCNDDDIVKLNKLVDVYTLNTQFLSESPLAVRLAVMMSASYGIQLAYKRVPHTLDQRHNTARGRQCLCQFAEEFLSAYLPCVRRETEITNLTYLFLKYLNCQFKPDKYILQDLGITTLSAGT